MTYCLASPAPEVAWHDTCAIVKIYFDEQPWGNKFFGENDVPEYRHVFTCHGMDDEALEKPAPAEADDIFLELAFREFNIGDEDAAADYRALGLRSLSVGDVVEIDGRQYRCASFGWDRVPDEVRA